jgi:hypothetical protein
MFGFGPIDKFSSATVYLKYLYQAGKVSNHDLCVKGIHVTSLYGFSIVLLFCVNSSDSEMFYFNF